MLHCCDPLFSDEKHSEARDKAMLDILLAVVETSYTTLPLTGRVPCSSGDGQNKHQHHKIIPGWSKEVEPLRLQSNACYRAWLVAGKPRQGDVFNSKLLSFDMLYNV